MPKIKTNSGAKKRFALTGSGKNQEKHAFKSHILTKKTEAKTQPHTLRSRCGVDVANVKALLA